MGLSQGWGMPELAKISPDYVVQARSEYQIRKFVIGQHDTDAQRFRQLIIEAQTLGYTIAQTEIALKKSQIEMDQLLATGDEIDALDAEEKRLGMRMTELTLEGARREMAVLEEIFNEMPHFSQEDIEADQPIYWQKRLTRQAEIDQASIAQGISAGNLQSLLSAGLVQQNEVEA